MLSSSLLILSGLTLALGNAVPPLSTCILGNPCPTGSTCTPTQTCGGLCVTSVTPPPVVPCTVGNDKPCPTNAICTPTSVCQQSPTPCDGQCIATTNPPAQPLPTQPCVIGANNCPSNAFCTQTEVCGGLCKCKSSSIHLVRNMRKRKYHERKKGSAPHICFSLGQGLLYTVLSILRIS